MLSLSLSCNFLVDSSWLLYDAPVSRSFTSQQPHTFAWSQVTALARRSLCKTKAGAALIWCGPMSPLLP